MSTWAHSRRVTALLSGASSPKSCSSRPSPLRASQSRSSSVKGRSGRMRSTGKGRPVRWATRKHDLSSGTAAEGSSGKMRLLVKRKRAETSRSWLASRSSSGKKSRKRRAARTVSSACSVKRRRKLVTVSAQRPAGESGLPAPPRIPLQSRRNPSPTFSDRNTRPGDWARS